MKKLVLIVLSFLLIGCIGEAIDYSDFNDRNISWQSIFKVQKDSYYVYVYAESCYYCQQIKNEVLNFANSYDDFYFLEFNEDVILSNYVEDTIGIKDVEHLKILGTPTLLQITNDNLTLNISGKTKILDQISISIAN